MTEPPSDTHHGSGPSGRIVLLLWLLTFVLAYVVAAPLFNRLAQGVDLSRVGKLPGIVGLLSLATAIVASVRWARSLGPREHGASATETHLGRRRFLAGGAAVVGGVIGSTAATLSRNLGWLTVTVPAIWMTEVVETDPNPRAEWKGARVQSYRRLGRTGFRVSDISLGSGQIDATDKGESIAREAIERGVNYFDTAPDYSQFGSEIALGRAMKGHRDEMFLATKFCTSKGHLPAGSSVDDYVSVVEDSLKRLQTDYVDLVHVHACNSLDRLLDPNVHEAIQRLKDQGKARFLGVSTHTPDLETIANAAIDHGGFDVMMLAYHYGAWPHLGAIIERAAAADMGVVAMKTLKGAKHRGMAEFMKDGSAYSQAAFKWVLSNPSVSCLVISFYEHQHVDEYLYASGKRLSDADVTLLDRYDRAIAGQHCFAHCGDCLASCPEQLAINDVLRYRMYFEDYGREKRAIQAYAGLEKKADVCVGCSAPCAGACPHGVPIRERMIGADRMLRLG
jgi:predicted aldo/keto reductase-like oxidoreductase